MEEGKDKTLSTNTLSVLNSKLASSAQQPIRDQALTTVSKLLSQGKWVDDTIKDLRIMWQGIFYMLWHSDKPLY